MPKWDYVCVNLVRSYGMNYRRNGIKMAAWKDKPVFEVMQFLGDEGYEFAAYDGQNYIFKKPLGAPQQATTGQLQSRPAQPQPGQAPQGQGQPGQTPRPTQPGQAPQGQVRPGATPPTAPLRSLQRPTTQDEES